MIRDAVNGTTVTVETRESIWRPGPCQYRRVERFQSCLAGCGTGQTIAGRTNRRGREQGPNWLLGSATLARRRIVDEAVGDGLFEPLVLHLRRYVELLAVRREAERARCFSTRPLAYPG